MSSSEEIGGIRIATLQDMIYFGLAGYAIRTNGEVRIRFVKDENLQATPTKPNAARMPVEVIMGRRVVGNSLAIIFAPGKNGTGDTVAFGLEGLNTGQYPNGDHVVPRPKTVHTEAQATLFAARADSPNANPQMFAGSYHLLGEERDTPSSRRLVCLGILGQSATEFAAIMAGFIEAEPTTTYTTGFKDPVNRGGRHGDPHSVLNVHDGTNGTEPLVQGCLFVALGYNSATPETLAIFSALGARMPLPTPTSA